MKLSEEKPDGMEWCWFCFILCLPFFKKTNKKNNKKKPYELKKRHNKQHHCALATLPSVADECTSIEYHSVLASQIAHCSASTTRERHFFKAVDSIYDSKRHTSYGLLEQIKSRSLLTWIKLSKFPITGSLEFRQKRFISRDSKDLLFLLTFKQVDNF